MCNVHKGHKGHKAQLSIWAIRFVFALHRKASRRDKGNRSLADLPTGGQNLILPNSYFDTLSQQPERLPESAIFSSPGERVNLKRKKKNVSNMWIYNVYSWHMLWLRTFSTSCKTYPEYLLDIIYPFCTWTQTHDTISSM